MADFRPSLASVLDHYGVQFSPSRNSQMVKCPIHGEDRTPSMSINLERGLYNCHSCGEAGDVFTMIMKQEGVGFVKAKQFARSTGFDSDPQREDEDDEEGTSRYGRTVSRSRKSAGPGGSGGFRPRWRSE